MFTGHEVIQDFLDQGFELLGNGCYAAVFASKTDPNVVYKVGVNVEDPFLDYINLTSFEANEHFPKVHKLHLMEDYYIAVMEALTPVPHHKISVCDNIRKAARSSAYADDVTINMVELITEIQKLANRTGNKLDLHDGNIMMRGFTPVITDPLCGTNIYSDWSLEGWLNSPSYESAL